ncbi:acyclic terpene utilization AtuA family protein [Dactylosporangium sp. CS-033363]|uniref:acyclic terpene utilization AtuA family protein n=1 Tax=Dactylosporangium sp. CS-033363 TaxID=3239935 RepID=UPI003D8CCBF8
MARPVRIANFSGAMGDKFSAFAEAVHGNTVGAAADVVIGDSMAEITMSMVVAGLRGNREARRQFFSEYFLRQLRPELAAIAERRIKVVTNAGVYNPSGLAAAIRAEIAERGLDLRVAYVTGDDLTDRLPGLLAEGRPGHLETGAPLTVGPGEVLAANAYLGGWGIKTALDAGADIVITGRVADASLVTGPAAWWHGWGRDDLDRIAGATAAAHIIECGPQATGGNFAGFTTIPDNAVPGFPIAEVAEDGTFVITKRPGDGGAVTVDTVTAQLMYEIQGPRYLNPDVVWHTDAIELTQDGPDRVRVTGAKGSAAPPTTKAGLNFQRGYRGAIWLFPTGLDVPEKLEVLRAEAERARKDHPVDELHFFVCGRPVADPKDQYQATVPVQVAVAAGEQATVAGFLGQFTSYGLGSIPGFYIDLTQMYSMTGQPRIDYWPGLVRQADLAHQVHLPDGTVVDIAPPPGLEPFAGQPETAASTADPASFGPTETVPFGRVVYARTGDKGANANLGVWARDAAGWPWLAAFLTEERLRDLLGCPDEVVIERYEQPRLRGISFVLRGYFPPSGSANLALDSIGKSLGEFLRARHVAVPTALLAG